MFVPLVPSIIMFLNVFFTEEMEKVELFSLLLFKSSLLEPVIPLDIFYSSNLSPKRAITKLLWSVSDKSLF